MDVCVFKRYELKYLLTETQYYNVLKRAAGNLVSDFHGQSTIQSIYYDTDDYRLIRRSLERPEYKEKLRLRSYGLADGNDSVFMELKKKCSGVVYKRRIETTVDKVKKNDLGDSQIAREIEYFRSYYNNPRPKIILIYDRTAYAGKDDLRVTFDKNIRYRTNRLSLCAGLDGTPVLPESEILMEIKTSTSVPFWLARILSEEHVVKTSFSKYGAAYKELQSPVSAEVKKVG